MYYNAVNLLNFRRKNMLKETFAERLKTAMDLQGKKQVDLIRIASQQGG